MKKRRFTKAELDYLMSMLGEVPRYKLTKRMNQFCERNGLPPRTERSVIKKAEKIKKELGLQTLIPSDNHFSILALSEYVGIAENQLRKWVRRGLLTAKKENSKYRITLDQFKSFGLKHPDLISQSPKEILIYLYGKTKTEQILKHQKPKRCSKPIKVKDLRTGKTYNSIMDASKATGYKHVTIRYWIRKGEFWEMVK
jgi:hypothetical protein